MYERTVARGSGKWGGGNSARASPASLSGSGSAGRSGSPPSASTRAAAAPPRRRQKRRGAGRAAPPRSRWRAPARKAALAPLDLGRRERPAVSPHGRGPPGSLPAFSTAIWRSICTPRADVETRMSDDFRMFEFKVRRVFGRARRSTPAAMLLHDTGEKARRRDPRRLQS